MLDTMTAGVYVTGTHVASVESGPSHAGRSLNRAVNLVHAVSRPVVDGLASSECGVLVVAMADTEWDGAIGVPRCEECARIAG
jgi:hypothetical protein